MHWDGDLIVICSTIVALSISLPFVRFYIRRMESGPRPDALPSGEVLQRLNAIEQAVESIAVEVERISENQRFTTRLLAGREGAALGTGSRDG